MKKIIGIISTSLLLLGCQSTTYTQKTYDEAVNDAIVRSEQSIETKTATERFQLATTYTLSQDQEIRAKAIPLLKELEKEGNMDAIEFLALVEHVGRLGYVSDKTLQKHKESLNQRSPEAIKNIEIELQQWHRASESDFASLKMAYDSGVPFCSQPLEEQPVSLNEGTDVRFIQYLSLCLSAYSHKTDAVNRLNSLASLVETVCEDDSDKTCISVGYRTLANNRLLENLNSEEMMSMAAALRSTLNQYKNYLQNTSKQTYEIVSTRTGKVVQKAFEYYNNANNEKALEVLIQHSSTLKDKSFDKAYVDRFIGNIKASIAETPELQQEAIDWLTASVEPGVLNNKDQWGTILLIGDLYFLKEDYKAYAYHAAKIIRESTEYKSLIPEQTLSTILTNWEM